MLVTHVEIVIVAGRSLDDVSPCPSERRTGPPRSGGWLVLPTETAALVSLRGAPTETAVSFNTVGEVQTKSARRPPPSARLPRPMAVWYHAARGSCPMRQPESAPRSSQAIGQGSEPALAPSSRLHGGVIVAVDGDGVQPDASKRPTPTVLCSGSWRR